MQIAGYTLRLLKGRLLCSSPGVFVFTHINTGLCFVSGKRNCRHYRGKINYPKPLKELVRTHPSEVAVFMSELPADTKEEIHKAVSTINQNLKDKGVLFKKSVKGIILSKKATRTEKEAIRLTVWKLEHKKTGAIFHFEEVVGQEVESRISKRMLTFNNYVLKNIANANRVMYYFVKKVGFVDIKDWTITDLGQAFTTEKEAILYITKASKELLEAGKVVLNYISSSDALYYRNTYLKLPHLGIDEYLKDI